MAAVLRRLLAPAFRNGSVPNRLLNMAANSESNSVVTASNIYLNNSLQNKTLTSDSSTKLIMLPSSIISFYDPTSKRKSPIMDLPKMPFMPELPAFNITPKLDMPIIENTFECPNNNAVQEKQAARLIVIRRKKMNKHKLKKLRKRQKFENMQRRQKSKLKKEKHFHLMLSNQMKKADRFSPEKYIENKLKAANRVVIPKTYRGRLYPTFMIRQFLGLDPRVKYKQF